MAKLSLRIGLALGLALLSSAPLHAQFHFSFGSPRVRICGSWFVPQYAYPAWGWASPYYFPPPVVVIAPPVPLVHARPQFEPREAFEAIPPLPAPPDELAQARVEAAVNRGELLVVLPNARGNLARVPEPKVVVKPLAPIPKEPIALAAYRVQIARTAFETGDAGRAAEQLEAASLLIPAEPLPYFLLAQARMARGGYVEAVAAIREGMKKNPDWPANRFRVKELYGKRPEWFDRDLIELRNASITNPDDPAINFLYAYFLWFNGQRDAAVKLFQKVKPLIREKGLIERFLIEADVKS